ncbi:MAG: PH domain-containing protein [Limisphaerales bacterium]
MSVFPHEHVLALLDPETPPAQLEILASQLEVYSQITNRQAMFLRLEAMQRRRSTRPAKCASTH